MAPALTGFIRRGARLLRSLLLHLFPQLAWRERLRRDWGRPGSADGACAAQYFELTQSAGRVSDAVVDERTWHDLELPRVFQDMDTTLTLIGRQCLYKQLRTYEADAGRIAVRWEATEALQTNAALREVLQGALLRARELDVVELLLGPPPQLPQHHEWVLPWVLLTVAAVAAAIAHLITPWVPLTLFGINTVIWWRLDHRIDRYAQALLSCSRLPKLASRLAAARAQGSLAALEEIAAQEPLHRHLGSQIKWLTQLDWLRHQAALDPFNPIFLLGGVVTLLNCVLLMRLAIYVQTIGPFLDRRPQWLSLYEAIGSIDACIAVAAFLQRHPGHVRAQITPGSRIEIQDGYHPLIAAPVKSSIVLERRSALVTGSNMTGKTTFIKMIAVNVILGRTLGVCLAARAVIPATVVRAFVRGEQSVESGRSKYHAEAEAIRGFLEEARTGAGGLFVLDEPFSGTNVVERIAVAKAILRAISQHAQVLVTTHDVELQSLLGESFELFHFREDPEVAGFFDYQLRAGASTQRNAIRVLERLGLPADVIAEALQTAAALGNERTSRH